MSFCALLSEDKDLTHIISPNMIIAENMAKKSNDDMVWQCWCICVGGGTSNVSVGVQQTESPLGSKSFGQPRNREYCLQQLTSVIVCDNVR